MSGTDCAAVPVPVRLCRSGWLRARRAAAGPGGGPSGGAQPDSDMPVPVSGAAAQG